MTLATVLTIAIALLIAGGLAILLPRAVQGTSGKTRTKIAPLGREVPTHIARERLFSAMVESSDDAIVMGSLDGIITGWNRAAEQLYGYSAEEAIGKPISILVPADRRREADDNLRRIANGEHIEHYETVRLHKGGSLVDVSISISPIRGPSGEITGASKTARGLSAARRTERALQQQLEERRQIFETSQDLILILDTTGTVVQVSPSSEAILGLRPEEMIGRSGIDFIHPDHLESAVDKMRALARGERPKLADARFHHKNGREVWLSWLGSYSEAAKRFYFVGRDMTDKIAAEERIRHAEKMEAIGQLTGGVAHDFNNILTVITGTIEMLTDAVAKDQQAAAITRMIDEAASRGAQLTQGLLAFARKQPLQPREIDINSLVADTARLLRPTLGEHIQVETTFEEKACVATVDPNQLTTAILNLALNARDAMPDGGRLILETGTTYLDKVYADANDIAPGHYVLIAVTDTGTGIPANVLDKVFDPFFTSKGPGKGTGLGLPMVYGFITQSAGHIKVDSEEGRGTTIKMYLPPGSLDAATCEGVTPATIEGGHETILVVEDDRLVRNYVLTQLHSLGYTTLQAANAAEALAIVAAGNRFDLLFTDVIMPGEMNGRQLADELQKANPDLRVVYTSGYTEDIIIHHGRLDADVLLLAKPYRKSDLARILRKALDG